MDIEYDFSSLEKSHLLPYTYISGLKRLDNLNDYRSTLFLLPRTAAVLLMNGLITIENLMTVQTERLVRGRENGVALLKQSPRVGNHIIQQAQFVRFIERIGCQEINDPRT